MKHSLLRDAIRRALFAGAVVALALPLHAQEGTGTTDAGTAAAPTQELDTITVTGSRIARAVDRENVQPVGIITREDMQRSGFQSVATLNRNALTSAAGSVTLPVGLPLASTSAIGSRNTFGIAVRG